MQYPALFILYNQKLWILQFYNFTITDYGMGNQIAKEDPVIVQRYLPDPFLINGYKEDDQIVKQGFFLYCIQHCFICRLSDSTV